MSPAPPQHPTRNKRRERNAEQRDNVQFLPTDIALGQWAARVAIAGDA